MVLAAQLLREPEPRLPPPACAAKPSRVVTGSTLVATPTYFAIAQSHACLGCGISITF